MTELQLLFLHHQPSGRRLRIEVPTVFGRSPALHRYQDGERFSAGDAQRLAGLDWIQIKGDQWVSRTHGVLDPQGPLVRDLNSTNGIRVSGRAAETTPGGQGPPSLLAHGDVLSVGQLHFVVQLERVPAGSLCEWLALDRRAFLAPADSPEVAGLEAFLSERKGFQARSGVDWAEVEGWLEDLQPSKARLGIVVLALAGRPNGPFLQLGERLVDMAAIVAALSALPGSKLLALQADGDPTACEAAFAEHAYQDMILVTSTVPTSAGLHEPLENEGMSPPFAALASGARGGRRGLAPWHGVIDGLDGLIRADSNVLDQEWVAGYEGALRVVVGSRSRADPGEVELSYRFRAGDAEGTFRVRHHFDSDRDGSELLPDARHSPSWREELDPPKA